MLRKIGYLAVPVGIVGIAFAKPAIAQAEQLKTSAASSQRAKPWDVYCEPTSSTKPVQECEMEKSVQSFVATCRQEVTPIKDGMVETYSSAKATVLETSEAVMNHVRYLQTEATDEVKAGTIAGAFVLGYILSLRRRFLRKLFNASLLASATGAIAYPKESKCIARNGVIIAKSAVADVYGALGGGSGR